MENPGEAGRGIKGERGFGHERLVVYRRALEFYGRVLGLVRPLARRDARLADQLQRAAASVPLNIAEGAGEFRPAEKARFYRIALRSATECAAVLDLMRLQANGHDPCPATRAILSEIVAMLTRLANLPPPSPSPSNSPSNSSSNSN